MGVEGTSSANRIISQLKKLGTPATGTANASPWTRGCSKAVREVFCKPVQQGSYLCWGHRIINWCPHCATALSDAEVEYETQPGKLWHPLPARGRLRAIWSL